MVCGGNFGCVARIGSCVMSKKLFDLSKDMLFFVSSGFFTVIIIFLIIITLIITPLFGLPMQTLSKYFKSIPNEYPEAQLAVVSDEVFLNGKRLCKSIGKLTEDKSGFRNLDYFIIKNDVLYFLAADYADYSEKNRAFDLYIGTIDLSDKALDYELIGSFGKNEDGDPSKRRYKPHFVVDTFNQFINSTTAVLCNDCIYIKDTEKVLKYSMDSGAVDKVVDSEEIFNVFSTEYLFEICENGENAIIKRLRDDSERVVSLEQIAQSSPAARKILSELSGHYIKGGHSYTTEVFKYSNAYYVGGDLFVSICIYNWYGEGIPVFFKYEYDTDKFYYVASGTRSDPVSTKYAVIVEK